MTLLDVFVVIGDRPKLVAIISYGFSLADHSVFTIDTVIFWAKFM